MEYSGYGVVCMKIISQSIKNRSLLVGGDDILCILSLDDSESLWPEKDED